MQITTFSAFYRLLYERAKPQANKTTAFKLAAQRFWYDGFLNRTGVSRECGISLPLARKWCVAAETLGITEDQRRSREDDPTFEAFSPPASTGPKDSKVEHSTTHELGGNVNWNDPRYKGKSTEELREIASTRATYDLINAGSPEQAAKAVDTLTKIRPGFKAPEVNVSVQAFINSGESNKLLEAGIGALELIADKDPDFIRQLFTRPELARLVEEVPDATLDDSSDSDAENQP